LTNEENMRKEKYIPLLNMSQTCQLLIGCMTHLGHLSPSIRVTSQLDVGLGFQRNQGIRVCKSNF
jgi:hypothetical protein